MNHRHCPRYCMICRQRPNSDGTLEGLARKRAQRGTLGYWREEERGHDALTTILAQDQIRIPELVPIRHQRMEASPWNYYRGCRGGHGWRSRIPARQRVRGPALWRRTRTQLRTVGHTRTELDV